MIKPLKKGRRSALYLELLRCERMAILRELGLAGFHRGKAAKALGITRSHLHVKVKLHDIDVRALKAAATRAEREFVGEVAALKFVDWRKGPVRPGEFAKMPDGRIVANHGPGDLHIDASAEYFGPVREGGG